MKKAVLLYIISLSFFGCSKSDNHDSFVKKLKFKEVIEETINQLDFFEQTTLVEAINFKEDTTSSLGIKYKIYMKSHNNCRSIVHDLRSIDFKNMKFEESSKAIKILFDKYYTIQLELLKNNRLNDNILTEIEKHREMVYESLKEDNIAELIFVYVELQIRLIHYQLMEATFTE